MLVRCAGDGGGRDSSKLTQLESSEGRRTNRAARSRDQTREWPITCLAPCCCCSIRLNVQLPLTLFTFFATNHKDMADTEFYTPSPSSSPSLAPIDSSPPSSPSPLALCTPPASPGAKDPFAGSTKSSKRPRIYARDDTRRRAANIQPYIPGQDKLVDAGDALSRDLSTENATPTRVVDPFSGSAKRTWRPPTHEKKDGRVLSTDSAFSASSSTSYPYGTRRGTSPTPIGAGIAMSLDDLDDDLVLTDDEFDKPKAKLPRETNEEVEHRAWDEAITAAIDKLSGIIDLACVMIFLSLSSEN